MSTYERVTPVEWDGAPTGYTITYHELRGYDSPDRWYEVAFEGQRIKPKHEFGDVRQAKRAAIAHARVHAWDNEADAALADPYDKGMLGSQRHRTG